MDYVFKGHVYVLTDGGSFSNSAIFASLIQFYKRGKIVGGETGGNGFVLSGGAGYFEAPNTGVNLLKITNQMITGNGQVNRQGSVKPNIVIQPGLPEILNNDDVVLKKLVEMIEKKQLGN
jgi:C-terminal processing protease CtpA/Prc